MHCHYPQTCQYSWINKYSTTHYLHYRHQRIHALLSVQKQNRPFQLPGFYHQIIMISIACTCSPQSFSIKIWIMCNKALMPKPLEKQDMLQRMSYDRSPFPEETAPSIHRPSSAADYGMQSSLQPSSLASLCWICCPPLSQYSHSPCYIENKH